MFTMPPEAEARYHGISRFPPAAKNQCRNLGIAVDIIFNMPLDLQPIAQTQFLNVDITARECELLISLTSS
jgi:hypothetical protein